MAVVLTWLDTEQGRSLSSWLAKSADAPGADSYVDVPPISFSVRADEYVKETFGGVTAECGRSVNEISSGAPGTDRRVARRIGADGRGPR